MIHFVKSDEDMCGVKPGDTVYLFPGAIMPSDLIINNVSYIGLTTQEAEKVCMSMRKCQNDLTDNMVLSK